MHLYDASPYCVDIELIFAESHPQTTIKAKLFLIEQEVGAKLNGIEWHSGSQPLMASNGNTLQSSA